MSEAIAKSKARVYLEKKNIHGFPHKALTFIGRDLVEFDLIDKDKNGKLCHDEILKMLQKRREAGSGEEGGFDSQEEAEAFLKELDGDGNGVIDQDEWMQKIILKWAKYAYIRPLITYDPDRDSHITVDELVKIFVKEGYEEASLRVFVHEQGLNKEGKVNYKEFLATYFDVNLRK